MENKSGGSEADNFVFSQAAMRIANLEEELSDIMIDLRFDTGKTHHNPNYYVLGTKDLCKDLSIWFEEIPSLGIPATISFIDWTDTSASADLRYAKAIGIDTHHTLSISLHTDTPTQKAYEEHTANALLPISGNTTYFFTKEGEYGKISTIPYSAIPSDPNRVLLEASGSQSVYQSEMTPGDFELVGTVLTKIKEAITPPEKSITKRRRYVKKS